MKYKTGKGIILTEICGKYLLVAAKEAVADCPYMTEVNDTTAECWKLMERGISTEEMTEQLIREYEIEDTEQVKADVSSLVSQLNEMGYIHQMEEE